MPIFSEPEQFLIRRWADSCIVEEAMKTIRGKYKEIWDQILSQVTTKHPELDYSKKYIVPGEAIAAVARDSWPKGRWDWPCGFYIDEFHLECLTSPRKEPPNAYVWIDDTTIDWAMADARLVTEAKRLLTDREFDRMDHAVAKQGVWFGCQLDRNELTRRLLEDEAAGLVSYIADQFEWMVRFAPVVDELLMHTTQEQK